MKKPPDGPAVLSARRLPRRASAVRASRAGPVLARWGAVLSVALAALAGSAGVAHASSSHPLSGPDAAFVTDLEHRAVRFFVEHSDPRTGLTQDRAPTNGATGHAAASAAATGFALTAWCIADARGWLPPGEALRRVQTTLRFAATRLEQERGWFYHFVDPRTGRRSGDSEVSTIDTALFLQGAIFAREYFHDPVASTLVDAIYRRIDWRWARNGRLTLSMGWRPEDGFIAYRWDSYCELMGMYLLGLGAPSHPLPRASWDAWRRGPRVAYGGRTFIQCSPLFTHQYSHAWFDFRGVRDGYADYWQNSVDATLAQRAWSAAQHGRFHHWSTQLWGLTASDGPHGYMAWGTPGPAKDESDGTLVPCAPGGSLPFAPRECLEDLQAMRQLDIAGLWGRYGFADAFNPETGWVSPDVIGIDVGITLVMAENLRSGLVWQRFMKAPEVQRGMLRAGFSPSPRAPQSQSLLTSDVAAHAPGPVANRRAG